MALTAGDLLVATGEARHAVKAMLPPETRGIPLPPDELVVRLIEHVELDARISTVGLGGRPDLFGIPSFDATMVAGDTLRCASVAALEHTPSAIRLALQLLRSASPHVLVAGARGTSFLGDALGVAASETLHVDARCEYDAWVKKTFPEGLAQLDARSVFQRVAGATVQDVDRALPKDTVGVLYRRKGSLWAGVSTSGWYYKLPGRVGDAAVYGAGIVADSRVGAVVCTHFGELAIRTQAAGRVLFALEQGQTPAQAVEALAQYIRTRPSLPKGPLVVHVLPREGEAEAFALGKEAAGATYFVWKGDKSRAEEKPAQQLEL